MKYTILFVVTLCCLTIISCDHKSHSHKHSDNQEQSGKEYTSQYICPMHCEGSGSETAGTCPVCGMDYVLNENFKSQEQDHDNDHDHEGHDHDGHNH